MVTVGWEAEDYYIHSEGEKDAGKQWRERRKGEEEDSEEVVLGSLFKRNRKLSVYIPDSTLSNVGDLRRKTIKFHEVLRTSCMFRVDELVVFKDPLYKGDLGKDRELMEKLHKYFTTPPYLRKKLVPIDPLLKYVGELHPIRLAVFNVKRNAREQEYRVGLVKSVIGLRNIKVSIGLSRDAVAECIDECPRPGELVVVKVESVNPLKVMCDESCSKVYTGPVLKFSDDIAGEIEALRRKCYVIATSRIGRELSLDYLQKLRNELLARNCIAVLFGSPYRGLYAMFESINRSLDECVDAVLNTLPRQGTVSVRSEEALHSTLTIINLLVD
ncbi:MAG: putative RNA uridine N3 methyltransferase [Desulfurococcaceae archaeon]